jgi:catechol 2,3-dioxygenase-like lactoylglutathione lyase family enzyme
MPNALNAFDIAPVFGGKVSTELGDYAYGASTIPDQDEMKTFPVRYGKLSDPDGYTVEVTEDASVTSPSIFKVVLNVLDLDETVNYFTTVLGMKLLRRRSNVNSRPRHGSMCAYVVSLLG